MSDSGVTVHDELALALASYLATLAGQPVEITALRRISDGWESDVYAFDAPAWREGGYVLRLYFGAESGEKALHEYRALDLLARAGYPVPRVEVVEPSTQPLGRSFLIMQRVEGTSLGRLWLDPDAAVREREIERFCRLFAQLHTLTWQHLPGAEHVPAYTISAQLDFWDSFTKMSQNETLRTALKWLRAASEQVTPQPLGLVHWDFHHENILVDGTSRAWVIDWTQLQASDVRFDLAWTLILLASERDAQTAAAVREAYFAQRGWTEDAVAAELRFFEAAAAVKRLVSVLVSLGSGADTLGMRPGAEAIMSGRLPRFATVYRRWLELSQTPLPDVEKLLAGHL